MGAWTRVSGRSPQTPGGTGPVVVVQPIALVQLVLLGLDEVSEEVVIAEVGVIDQALEIDGDLRCGEFCQVGGCGCGVGTALDAIATADVAKVLDFERTGGRGPYNRWELCCCCYCCRSS